MARLAYSPKKYDQAIGDRLAWLERILDSAIEAGKFGHMDDKSCEFCNDMKNRLGIWKELTVTSVAQRRWLNKIKRTLLDAGYL